MPNPSGLYNNSTFNAANPLDFWLVRGYNTIGGKTMEEKRCSYIVYIRDTYRYTGRGKNGFEMHFNKRECKRKATHGDKCWQHDSITRRRS